MDLVTMIKGDEMDIDSMIDESKIDNMIEEEAMEKELIGFININVTQSVFCIQSALRMYIHKIA